MYCTDFRRRGLIHSVFHVSFIGTTQVDNFPSLKFLYIKNCRVVFSVCVPQLVLSLKQLILIFVLLQM